MKNIFMVQASVPFPNSIYLPYSAGAVISYSLQFEKIKENFNFVGFIYEIQPIDEVIEKINNPAVVGFSSYMWNIEFNLELAKAIKNKWPDCIIIFGGPQIDDEANFLGESSCIDILIYGEGEIPFYKILLSLVDGSRLKDISNIAFTENDTLIRTKREYVEDVSCFPSPYTMGLFDNIVNGADRKNVQFDAVLETNRGCPYKCIYCYWAGGSKKIRSFSMEKIKAELEWMSQNKILFCYCADANFGILDRDIEIAEYIVELKNEYGYPQRFESIASKNKNEVTLEINKILHTAGLNGGISVAVQSMSPKVLNAVGRKNISIEELGKQLNLYRMNGMTTYTDIILGLPEETYKSFCRGVFAVLEAGQHNALNIFRCELLPNTILSDISTVEKYGIQTIKSHLCQNHSTVGKNVFNACSNIIVSTNSLTKDEWLECNKIAIVVQAFHCFGLLRYIAIYIRKSQKISYENFYMSFYNWIENESTVLKNFLDEICNSFKSFLDGESDLYYYNPDFGNIYYPFEEALFLLCVSDMDSVYDEINNFLQKFYCFPAVDELLEYQKNMIHIIRKEKPQNYKYQNDWYTYFSKIYDGNCVEPENKNISVFCDSYDHKTMENYAREVVWYGKRIDKMIENVSID